MWSMTVLKNYLNYYPIMRLFKVNLTLESFLYIFLKCFKLMPVLVSFIWGYTVIFA